MKALSLSSGVLLVHFLPKPPTCPSPRKALTIMFTVACVIPTVLAISLSDAPFGDILTTCSLVYTGTRGGIIRIPRNVLKRKLTWPTHIHAELQKCPWALRYARMTSCSCCAVGNEKRQTSKISHAWQTGFSSSFGNKKFKGGSRLHGKLSHAVYCKEKSQR